jgi:hypothetical protein
MDRFGKGRRNAVLAWGVVFFFLLAASQAEAVASPSIVGPANGATVLPDRASGSLREPG